MARINDSVPAQAVGSAEAAAIMGVHFVMPRRMAERGLISAHICTESANVDEPERFYAIYDSAECDANYREYEEKVAARGGKNDRRPRAWLHLRPEVVAHLAKEKVRVAFDDAVSLGEASMILGVHHTLVPRMLRAGTIVGRIAWTHRAGSGLSRVWIVSRKSCLANVKTVKALEASGKKRGRPRRKLAAKKMA
jgi:hypothetical protein